jgi:hypothetical protein
MAGTIGVRPVKQDEASPLTVDDVSARSEDLGR